jgi:hypothetical protein
MGTGSNNHKNFHFKFLASLKKPITYIKLALVTLACVVGATSGLAMRHHINTQNQKNSQSQSCVQNCQPPSITGSNTDNNSHDEKVEEDLNNIDNSITTRVDNAYNAYYNGNAKTDNPNVNVNSLGIKDLNYSLSSYKIGDMQPDTGPDGEGAMYTICAKFNKASSDFAADAGYTGTFTTHASGEYCFAVDDGDGPDSGVTGYYPGQAPNFE